MKKKITPLFSYHHLIVCRWSHIRRVLLVINIVLAHRLFYFFQNINKTIFVLIKDLIKP